MKKIIVLTVMSVMFFLGANVQAAESENGGFSVTPINVITGKPLASFYDLKVKPNEKITLPIDIENSGAADLNIKVEVNDGTTNNNGITAYDGVKKRDSSLKVAFTDMASTAEQSVTVKARSKKRVKIDVTIPTKPFEGSVLGGLRFSEIKSEEQKKEQKTAVANNIAYVIGVVLQENDKEIAPIIGLNEIVTEQRNYRNYISANLQNSAPRIIKKMTAHAQVYKQGEDKLLYEATNENMRMAPHSNFNFGINLGDKAFIAGDYTMVIKGEADGKAYSFTKDFVIKGKEARAMNENAVFVEDTSLSRWWFLAGGALVISLLIIIIILLKNRKKEKINEQ